MRNVVVSGGGTGIGRAVATRFAQVGDAVTIVGRRGSVLDEAARGMCGGPVRVEPADLTDPAEVAALADRLGSTPIDVVVCAAGGLSGVQGEDLEATSRRWVENLHINVLSAVLLAQALLPVLAQPGGRIVAVSSVASRKGTGSYGAAKAALNAWIVDLAGELAPQGVTVNAVAPGFIPDTGFWEGRLGGDQMRKRLASVKVGRPGTPEEVAEAVAYLASPLAGFTTGHILDLNGGAVLGV